MSKVIYAGPFQQVSSMGFTFVRDVPKEVPEEVAAALTGGSLFYPENVVVPEPMVPDAPQSDEEDADEEEDADA